MSNEVKIDKFGFREYDARWVYEKDINKAGIKDLGKGFGSQIIRHTKKIIQELSLVTITDRIAKK